MLISQSHQASSRDLLDLEDRSVDSYDPAESMLQGQGLPSEALAELCHTTELALQVTKQTATAISHLMTALVVMERYLWLNLLGIRKKREFFLP